MATYISSAFVTVDTTLTSKTVILPPASSVVGKIFTVLQVSGGNTLTLSTMGGNTIDLSSAPFILSNPICLVAQSSSNYSVLTTGAGNYNWLNT